MALLRSIPSIATASLITILLLALPHPACSQAPANSNPPLIASCMSHLLPLSPCASYVQGRVQSPAQMCCVNLKQVYSQHPGCLCLLLNGTTLSNIPINTTLALQLPVACALQADVSTCSASPMVVPVAPRPNSIMGFNQNAGANLNAEGQLALEIAVLAVAILFAIH